MITEEGVLEALRKVNDPELHRDLVSLGMVKEIKVAGGAVAVTVELTTPACPMRAQVEAETQAAAARRVSGWRSPFWGRSRWTPSSAGGGTWGSRSWSSDPTPPWRLSSARWLPMWPGGLAWRH
jgi:metal-sulfur cluster biosynthetic enzyme